MFTSLKGKRMLNGVTEHRYETLISSTLFKQVQNVTAGYHKKPFKASSEPFILRGLITCSHCGCIVTPEIKKQRYIYYSCTNAKGNCQRTYVRKEPLIEILSAYFDRISLSKDQIASITNYLKEIYDSHSRFHNDSLETLRKEQDRIQMRLNLMYEDKLDGIIDQVTYLEKVKKYKARQLEIVEQMKKHEFADQNFHITANLVMNLAARAKELYESSEADEKRQLLNLVFQNLKLDGRNLVIDICEPFATIMKYKEHPGEWGQLDSNQRRPKSRDLQSLAIAAMRYPRKRGEERLLTVGIEPTTARLQVECSTN